MEIQLLDFGTVVSQGMSGQFHAVGLGTTGDLDPDGNFYALTYTKAGMNMPQYSNPELDRLLDAARHEIDQSKRLSHYKAAQKVLFQDQPFVVYYNPPQVHAMRKVVQGYPESYNGYWGSREFDRIWKSK
jgi:peptide/nickel transport system substrate-binding protein